MLAREGGRVGHDLQTDDALQAEVFEEELSDFEASVLDEADGVVESLRAGGKVDPVETFPEERELLHDDVFRSGENGPFESVLHENFDDLRPDVLGLGGAEELLVGLWQVLTFDEAFNLMEEGAQSDGVRGPDRSEDVIRHFVFGRDEEVEGGVDGLKVEVELIRGPPDFFKTVVEPRHQVHQRRRDDQPRLE